MSFQIDWNAISAQIFWFIVSLSLLFLYINNYALKRIRKIQATRSRYLSNNFINTNKNQEQIKKIERLIEQQKMVTLKSGLSRATHINKELLALANKQLEATSSKLKVSAQKLEAKRYSLQNNLQQNTTSNSKQLEDLLLTKVLNKSFDTKT